MAEATRTPGELIFVNYRQNGRARDGLLRLPHAQVVEAVAERLRSHFGPDRVFLDTGIHTGEHYPDALREGLRNSALLVAVVHPGWARDLADRAGGLDWVRQEIRTALEEGKHVLPLLLDQAALPDPDALPDDLRPFAFKQARRIDFGHWERDVRLFVQEVEAHLSPVALPERVEPRVPAPRGPLGLVLAWLLGAVAPVATTTALVPDAGMRAAWLAALAITGVLLLLVPALITWLAYGARDFLDGLDHESALLPRDVKVDVITALVVAALAVFVLLSVPVLEPQQRMLLVAVAVVVLVVIALGVPWLRRFRTARQWPRPELEADPTTVREALHDVRRHLEAHGPFLNRLRRDQAHYALDQVEAAAARLRELADRDRATWLRAAPRLPVLAHALSFGATAGAAVAAAVVHRVSGGTHWSAPFWAVAGVVAATAGYGATAEAAYRFQRRRRDRVAAAAPAEVAALRQEVDESGIPRPAPINEDAAELRKAHPR
ncbi:toll/interleukin-1 receptor domain-containing protein [Saccharothrix xinjiangensis]|uniref:TIR domain-containing protein n=1 Tax=Saccharothrix xinjiangensis TaxID=204798 RepID=A0ABV9XUX1_9PSEU